MPSCTLPVMSAGSLRSQMIEALSNQLMQFCNADTTVSCDISNSFPYPDWKLPHPLGDELLHSLSEKSGLNEKSISFFTSKRCSLKHVQINAKKVKLSSRALRVLKGHKISYLKVTGLQGTRVGELISCLGEWSLLNLKHFNVSGGSFDSTSGYPVFISLVYLKNLRSLNVSQTHFNSKALNLICTDLPHLEAIDFSMTSVTSLVGLLSARGPLKSIKMYGCCLPNKRESLQCLQQMFALCELDISTKETTEGCTVPFTSIPAILLLTNFWRPMGEDSGNVSCDKETMLYWPNLARLDISGHTDLLPSHLENFVDCHKHLVFLGLTLTNASHWNKFVEEGCRDFRPSLSISGEWSFSQIKLALSLYTDRVAYVQSVLRHLFSLTCHATFADRQHLMELLLNVMQQHPHQLNICMAGTACLYNITKTLYAAEIHPDLLKNAVRTALSAMENFPNNIQLQKNTLLMLCNDIILQHVSFDRFWCSKLVLEDLCAFDDISMVTMAAAICTILAAKMSTEETTALGTNPRYMRKLLSIVRRNCEHGESDMILMFTLSALWNLTDESPPSCECFIREGGLELFIHGLMAEYKSSDEDDCRDQIHAKILGLLNNISEVPSLKEKLLNSGTLHIIRNFLRKPIDVAYFAGGVFAQLAVASPMTHFLASCLEELMTSVKSWNEPESEMVAYRRFTPFFPLLHRWDLPAVQLWAVWALQHVTNKTEKRYAPMLLREGGAFVLRELIFSPRTQRNVMVIAMKLLDILSKPEFSHISEPPNHPLHTESHCQTCFHDIPPLESTEKQPPSNWEIIDSFG